MSQQYFGTDGIRGKVGEFPMTPDFVMKLGWAAGVVLAADGTKEVLVGKDTRASGYMLESALEAGLSAAGVNIALAGPIPTPAVAYLASTFRADAGVVISASHNPYYDNGIKFFGRSGAKLGSEQQQVIEEKLQYALENGIDCVDSERLGKARRVEDAAGRYIEFCKSSVPTSTSFKGVKLVLDCAHGATYKVAPSVFRELGAEVVVIGASPDGLNINAGHGSTDMAALRAAVLREGADLGIAFDGDGDRVLMVDHAGEEVDGDELLCIIALDMQRRGILNGGVAGTLMSNLGLELALKEQGIPFVRAKVGDRYVMAELRERGWLVGGESSGHIVCLHHTSTGDGIIAALQVLKALQRSEQSLAQARSCMQKCPQKLINVRYAPGQASPTENPAVKQAVAEAESRLAGAGRVLLRLSGTEPLVRVMVEGQDAAKVEQEASALAAVVTQVCGG